MKVSCDHCKKEFHKQPHLVRKHKNSFCSRQCYADFRKQDNMVPCDQCAKVLYRDGRSIKRNERFFCSKLCRKVYSEDRSMKVYICVYCHSDFKRLKCKESHGRNKFCSQNCLSLYRNCKKTFYCMKCGKKKIQHRCTYERSNSHFCSDECKGKFYVRHSYGENLFEDMIKPLNIQYERNTRKIVRPLELDFWFPDISFAVELNGAQHYEPVRGMKKLKEQKARDKRRRLSCKVQI